MYWSADVEDIDEVDADEQESESVERTGDGAQWTVFFGAGVDAMRVELYQPQHRA